ncbi:MAG: DUF523 domain-containing protein [Bacillota bacterium]|nr:DUF523 domain-containing protein [Bacillota bacterium]
MILISACLCGIRCKYNQEDNAHPVFVTLLKEGKALPVCPEQLGGLPTPRVASEILNGTGNDVLNRHAEVITREGQTVTKEFILGAEEALKIAQITGMKKAVLKSRSPSCGVNRIYDGTFQSKIISGDGVAAALLRKNGIEVISDQEFLQEKGETIQ